MAVCGLRTLLVIVCTLELVATVERQVFDFLGYMWLPIIANFVNILLIIFGSFGAVQYITKYILAYAIWSFMWLTWNVFLICYFLNLGSLNRESGLLSLGTGSVSWWETNGWGCQPVWSEVDAPGNWRPTKVDGCLLQWHHVELGQSVVAALLTAIALPLAILLSYRSHKKRKASTDKGTLSRRPVYTIELSQTETNVSESSLKPMTPRRVKRRSGSRGTSSSVRRSRRSYRNAGYHASTASLPRDSRPPRPTSAHSSYSNFHAARPASYHPPEPDRRDALARSQDAYDPPPPCETIAIATDRYDTAKRRSGPSYDEVGPFKDSRYDAVRGYDAKAATYDDLGHGYVPAPYDNRADAGGESPYGGRGPEAWGGAPPPPAPPYSARATPQAPGPPAYAPHTDVYSGGHAIPQREAAYHHS